MLDAFSGMTRYGGMTFGGGPAYRR